MFQPTAIDVGSPGHPDAGRDPVLVVTTWVAGIAAAVASFAALYELARHTGWPWFTAPLYPLTIDSYAVAALRVWLGRSTHTEEARRRARRNAVGAIVWSVAGNAAFHAVAAHVFVVTWWMVVAVAATPPIVLGLVSHLFALRARSDDLASAKPTASFDGLADADELPAPRELPALAGLAELPSAEELAGLSKAEAIRIALRLCDGNVIKAQALLATRNVSVDRAYCHDVKAGRSGKRRRQRGAPALVNQPGEVAA
jgi:Protein of unknown function (DUF2637)